MTQCQIDLVREATKRDYEQLDTNLLKREAVFTIDDETKVIIKKTGRRLQQKTLIHIVVKELFTSMEKEINNITFHEGLPSSDQVDACSKDCACSLKMTKEMILIPKHKFEAVLQKQNEDQPKAEVVLNDTPPRDNDQHNLSYDQKPLHDDLQSLINITIPSRYKDKALRLLLYLQKQPSIKWDEQGEVCIDGKVISNTHIVDLIRDSTVPIGRRKLTAGIHQFYQFLKSTNIPLCLFRNVEKQTKMGTNRTTIEGNQKYYVQMQGEMAVMGLPLCDFVVWTNASKNNILIERICFDEAFCNALLSIVYE
ncbi:unnamed protein product [Mytilus edulis]|uniref:Uncharacterized protein n=1 Tax=Mytilus edulis TaxID=6550 RepID=A0A8S3UT06_MYTED|nr:unnamed protein product [Mytilus edulis]